MPRGLPIVFDDQTLAIIRKLYVEDGLSLPQITTVLDTSHSIQTSHGVIRRKLQDMGVPLRAKGRRAAEVYQGATTTGITTGVTKDTTTEVATEAAKPKVNQTPLYLPERIHKDIIHQYSVLELSLSNIAARYNSHAPIIRKLLRYYQIPLRPVHLGRSVSDTRAHQLVQEAIRRGDLTRRPCEYQDPQTNAFCAKGPLNRSGRKTIVVAHHDDYSYPLVVRWLCHKHHRLWHQFNEPVELTPEMEKELYGAQSGRGQDGGDGTDSSSQHSTQTPEAEAPGHASESDNQERDRGA